MKVIIAGTRTFSNYDLLKKILSKFSTITEVVSGGASGADFLGEKWAYENSLPIKKFLADWKLYGKKAGPIRNSLMAKYADCLIIFWDGKSRGSLNMINQMKKIKKPIKIISY